MHTAQAAILATVPPVGRYVFFNLAANATPATLRDSLSRLAPLVDGDHTLLAVGPQLVAALGATVPGLREFPAMTGHGADVPSTPTALCCWLRGDEKGDLLLQARAIEKALAPALHFHRAVDAFRYKLGASGHGRDLTGYEDGTENPDGDEAVEAALVQGQGAGLDGSSFVAMQQWVHDMHAFEATSGTERDHIMGRNLQTNDELEDAPESAHVKRTEQESFTPEDWRALFEINVFGVQRVIRAVWLQKGCIDCVGEEPNAVALWLEVKGQYREPLGELIRSGLVWTPVALGIGASVRLSKYSNAMLKLHRRHASGPHWYLQMVGVEPSKQGRGLGSRLLAHGLARASTLPVYLETDVERNVGLYRRHGFEVMEHASTAEPVPLWSMLRSLTPNA